MGRTLAIVGVVVLVGAGSASAASCPGANPCPYTGSPTVFGSYGVSYFNAQAGVAVDSSGNQYLTDWNNNRVLKFNSAGQRQWVVGAGNGSGQAGAGAAQFNHPYEVRLSPDGTKLYVADGYNNRIDELNSSDGSFVHAWGWGVNGGSSFEQCTTTCQAGIAGGGAGQLNDPVGLGVDPNNGNVYVGDYNNNRVDEFDPTGLFIATFGFGVADGVTAAPQVCAVGCSAGISGTGNGQFHGPIGVAVNASHLVWVADEVNGRVQAFGAGPSFTWSAASAGGLLNQPYGLAFDSSGNLLVADANHNELQALNPSTLALVRAYGWGVSDGVAQPETCTSSCLSGLSGGGNGQFSYPEDVAVDSSSGRIHVADNGNNRSQTLDSSGTYLSKLLSPAFPNTDLRLNQVSRILPAPDGNLWLADTYNNRVVKVTPTGTVLDRIGASNGDGGGPNGGSSQSGAAGIGLFHPFDMAFDSSGNLWVADAGNNRLDEFNPSGAFEKTIGWGVNDGAAQLETCSVACLQGLAGTGYGEFNGPQGLTVDGAGNLYVADTSNCRVQELTTAGSYIRRWGRGGGAGSGYCGSGTGEFSAPVTVKLDAAGHVWVADFNNSNVQEFTSSGGYLATVGGPGSTPGTFDGPQQLAFDSAGDLLVADTLSDRVQLLDPVDGSFGFAWGGPSGTIPGAGDFGQVGGVAILPNRQVAVSDQGNGRIELFSFMVPGASGPGASPAATHAALSGTVDPSGGVSAYHFAWGPTSAYGHVTPEGATGPGTAAQAVGATITGLTSSTTYHYALIASNPAGSSTTADAMFTTTPFGTGPPGSQGPSGTQGAGGAQGPGGGQGQTGQQGATGGAGPAGAPGRNATVVCGKATVRGKRVSVSCTVTLTLPAHDRVWVKLSRGRLLYAKAYTATRRAGRRKLRLTVLHAPGHGRYRLTLTVAAPHARARSFHWTVKL